MLLRLRVQGFKNLYDTEVRFGPFTCLAGANGAGKSNLFDAIHFLKLLTSHELIEAAQRVRDDLGFTGNPLDLFYRGKQSRAPWMQFEADLLTARTGEDRLRQPANASSTLLTYLLRLGYRESSEYGPLEILKEELRYTPKGDANKLVFFPMSKKHWLDSVVFNKRATAEPYLQTEQDGSGRSIIKVQQDGTSGRPSPRLAEPLPRTVLSELSASEAPTAVVARNAIAGWQLLQLEPSALRQPDDFRVAAGVDSNGSHMPATLHRMMQERRQGTDGTVTNGEAVRQRVANRLAELVEDVRGVNVHRDERRETLTLLAELSDGTEHPARSLSDGTLRFLALTLIEQGRGAGVYCLEEPENGIHPARIPAMLQLLRDIAVDPGAPPGDDNPLRQVIINTHSPSVVSEILDDELLVAEQAWADGGTNGFDGQVPTVAFAALEGTWRAALPGARIVSRGRLASYLNPILPAEAETDEGDAPSPPAGRRPRVKERPDLQMLLMYQRDEGEA